MSLFHKSQKPALFDSTRCRSVTFTARTWFSEIGDDGAPKPTPVLMPGQAFAIQALHPGSLRIEEISDDPIIKAAIAKARCFTGTPFEVFVSDGRRQYEWNRTSQ